jgi:hypothetical protein
MNLCGAAPTNNRHRREWRRVPPIEFAVAEHQNPPSPSRARLAGARAGRRARCGRRARGRAGRPGLRRRGDQKDGRPDLTRPEVAALLGRVFNLDALNALPPAQASDISWLLDWMEAANAVNKLLISYGAKPGPQPDLVAIQRNMTEYEDQYAAMMNFLIRGQAREAVSSKMFMTGLAPELRTRVREEGYTRARSATAGFILDAICSVILSGGKPAVDPKAVM